MPNAYHNPWGISNSLCSCRALLSKFRSEKLEEWWIKQSFVWKEVRPLTQGQTKLVPANSQSQYYKCRASLQIGGPHSCSESHCVSKSANLPLGRQSQSILSTLPARRWPCNSSGRSLHSNLRDEWSYAKRLNDKSLRDNACKASNWHLTISRCKPWSKYLLGCWTPAGSWIKKSSDITYRPCRLWA